jgi:hypothetical protein
MSVRDLAFALAINESEVIKTLFLKGVACSVTQTLDRDLVMMVCEAFEVCYTYVTRVSLCHSACVTLQSHRRYGDGVLGRSRTCSAHSSSHLQYTYHTL